MLGGLGAAFGRLWSSGGAALPPPFDPAILFANGEQGAWYDPSDLSTLFQDAAGTIPVTAPGQIVGRVNDKSGRGNHAIQSGADSLKPLLQQEGDKSFLLFDGVDDFLFTSFVDFTSTDKVSTFAGLKKNVGGDVTQIYIELGEGNLQRTFRADAPNTSANQYFSTSRGEANISSSQGATTNDLSPAPDTAVIATIHDIATNVSEIRRNKIAGVPGVGNKGTGKFGNYPLYVGRRSGTTLPFNGRIYGLIIRGALSSPDKISLVEDWLNSKTGAYS